MNNLSYDKFNYICLLDKKPLMRNRLVVVLFFVGINVLQAQVNWTNKNMFEQKNFIKNNRFFVW